MSRVKAEAFEYQIQELHKSYEKKDSQVKNDIEHIKVSFESELQSAREEYIVKEESLKKQ